VLCQSWILGRLPLAAPMANRTQTDDDYDELSIRSDDISTTFRISRSSAAADVPADDVMPLRLRLLASVPGGRTPRAWVITDDDSRAPDQCTYTRQTDVRRHDRANQARHPYGRRPPCAVTRLLHRQEPQDMRRLAQTTQLANLFHD